MQISPVVISHRGLKIEVGGGGGESTEVAPFAPLISQATENSQQLEELLRGLNQLKVPPDDVISIIRAIKESGNLHGVYEER